MGCMKNNVGIWASSDMTTRFLAPGHHPEAKDHNTVDRTEPVVEGLGHTIEGHEYHSILDLEEFEPRFPQPGYRGPIGVANFLFQVPLIAGLLQPV